MNDTKKNPSIFARWLAVLTATVLAATVVAQNPATGSIEGRVFDAGRGGYLERARLTLEGTTQEAFSDSSGYYRFTGVPAGRTQVQVFFTGLLAQTATVNVSAGQAAVHDITMGSAPSAKPRTTGDAVQLEQFVVGASKEMDGAAIAINEQRFARSIMNVVAADEFGTIVDGTPGEVMKFLPGITMDYSAGEARTVSMNGVPSANVPITVGGFDLASAAGNGTGRVTNLDQFSVNSISRIEVRHAPTPETTGSALAGSVNMVPRSAFERSRPSHTASVFLTLKDGDRSFHKTGGPLNEPTRKVTPGFSFSSIVPVNKRFGFTLSGNHVDQYSYQDIANSTWRGNGFATNVAATALTGLPDTTPDKPYLTDFSIQDSTRGNRADSAGLTVDYKLSHNDTVSLSFQYTWIGVVHNNRTLSFFVNRVQPGAWGPTFTEGTRYVAGSPTSTGTLTPGGFANPGGFGEIRTNGGAQTWFGTTLTPTLVWRHDGPLWKIDAGAGWSRASLHTRNVDKGYFGASQARRTGVRVSFADIFYLRPNTITVTDGLGVSTLTRIDRGQHTRKQYLRLFPNLNVGYNIRENLIARFAYYQSVGRPDFGQYMNGLTLPDTSVARTSATVISVNNPTIKAWSAETFKVRVEYYFEGIGTINLGGYRREFTNFFASTRFLVTPEFLSLYSLDPDEYGDYEVTTNHNLTEKVEMTGFEFDYKRSLNFLPHWARGIQVFANASAQRAPDGISRNFNFVRRSGSWGFSVSRPKFTYRMNWNYREPQRRGLIAVARSIEANTYNWGSKRLYLDVTLDYNLNRRFSLFASMRNINDQTEDSKIYGPNTPDYAKFRQRQDFGSAWTFGLRGNL